MILTVIKIGGSLCGSPRLERLLRAIADIDHVRPVIVAGGGPFADAVRQVQAVMPFDDGLAHRLALDAMGHLAEVFATRHARFVTVSIVEAVGKAHRAGRVPIWHPAELRPGHRDIPESWSITSDSLALWLATRLDAERLVLVKSVDVSPAADAVELARAGHVDDAFPGLAARFKGQVLVAGPAADEDFIGMLGPVRASSATP